MNTNIDQFYDVLIDVRDVEKKLTCLLVVLHALEEHYNLEEKQEIYSLINVFTGQINSLHQDISQALIKADNIHIK